MHLNVGQNMAGNGNQIKQHRFILYGTASEIDSQKQLNLVVVFIDSDFSLNIKLTPKHYSPFT